MATNEETTMALVAVVRQHALQNYNTDGWDYLVECWSDSEIAEKVQHCTTPQSAIAKIGKILKRMDSHRAEILSTEW